MVCDALARIVVDPGNGMENKRILIIDDDPEILGLLQIMLEREGADVFQANGSEEGLRAFWQVRPDLVILDIMMPNLSGWEICQRIRELADTPIVFLSVLDDEACLVRGLNLGADDYVIKPVKRDVLLARTEAILRRSNSEHCDESTYDDGYLRVDLQRKRVEVGGQQLRLTATEFALLDLLVRNAGGVCTMERIRRRIWGGIEYASSRTVHVFISQLRKKIEPVPHDPRYIFTEHGLGYRFEDG